MSEVFAYLLDKETVGGKTWVKATPIFDLNGPLRAYIDTTVVEELEPPDGN